MTAVALFTALRTLSRIGDVGLLEAELADLRERLEEIIVARIAAGDAHPDAAPEEEFADVAADEAGAAEDRDKLFVSLDHGVAPIAFSFLRLTRRGGAP